VEEKNWFLIYALGSAATGILFGATTQSDKLKESPGKYVLSCLLWPLVWMVDIPIWLGGLMRDFWKK
jgi:hypothetical protein